MIANNYLLKYFIWVLDITMQGAIATGNLADIVIWEPDVEFDLNDDYPVYFKHPVCLSFMSCIM